MEPPIPELEASVRRSEPSAPELEASVRPSEPFILELEPLLLEVERLYPTEESLLPKGESSRRWAGDGPRGQVRPLSIVEGCQRMAIGTPSEPEAPLMGTGLKM